MSWFILPAELRLAILRELQDFKSREYKDPATRHKENASRLDRQSVYAAICREWCTFFEATNFSHLIIHQNDLRVLSDLIQSSRRPLNHTRWIWLRIELPRYDCTRCKKAKSRREQIADNVQFTGPVIILFLLLAQMSTSHAEIELELSAHSPNDTRHSFPNFARMKSHTRWKFPDRPGSLASHTDEFHGWRQGRQKKPSCGTKLRLFGHPYGLELDSVLLTAFNSMSPDGKLPNVPVVTTLTIRRQCCRHFSVSTGLGPIIESLVCLKRLNYEPWQGVMDINVPGSDIRDQEHAHLLLDAFESRSSTLKQVSVYETSQPWYCPDFGQRITNPALGEHLSVTSRQFTRLHVAHMVDAKDFFHAFWKDSIISEWAKERFKWSNLTELSLTSKMLSPDSFNLLITTAAAAAEKMPRLEFMELWDFSREHQCVFIYEIEDRKCKMRFESSWGGRLSRDARIGWHRMIRNLHGFDLDIFHRKHHRIPNIGQMIKRLRSKNGLLTEASQSQIMRG